MAPQRTGIIRGLNKGHVCFVFLLFFLFFFAASDGGGVNRAGRSVGLGSSGTGDSCLSPTDVRLFFSYWSLLRIGLLPVANGDGDYFWRERRGEGAG